MAKEIIKDAEQLNLSELKHLIFAAENHDIPIVPAKGPCGGCDLMIKPQELASGPCGGCDLITPPHELANGPCGGCDVLTQK
ncbi:MAG: hypothetical protein SWO11_14365 [Thermodesulfobacteriota bacterium]|nr:hypothetical protein [Thermodesulfobacteriota bacterium]